MKQKKWAALLGMMAVVLILTACDGDSGNNSSQSEGNSSSIDFSSSGEQINSSSGLSSSSFPLSSSVGQSLSSSSVGACTNAYGTNTVTDCRDNHVYKTVTIGTQTWMAENLNYADTVV